MVALLAGSAAILDAAKSAVVVGMILFRASGKVGAHGPRIRPRFRATEIATAESAGDRVRIRNSAAMARIMRPSCSSKSAAMEIVETVAMEETAIQIDAAAEPAEAPTPSAPTAAAGEVESEINKRTPAPADADSRVEQRRPRIDTRCSPKISRVVGRNINHLRIGGLNLDRRLAILILRHDLFLRSIGQFAGSLGLGPQALDSGHYVGLLRKERVAKIGGPADIRVQTLHDILKSNQGLNAGIPILLFCGIDQSRSFHSGVLVQKLLRFHQLQRISTGNQHLAQQRIRIQSDGRHQAVQLFRSKRLLFRWSSRRSILSLRESRKEYHAKPKQNRDTQRYVHKIDSFCAHNNLEAFRTEKVSDFLIWRGIYGFSFNVTFPPGPE